MSPSTRPVILTALFGAAIALAPASARAANADVPAAAAETQADTLYTQARDAIEQARYDQAIQSLDRVLALKSPRSDAALYWKAYSLAKLGRQADALAAVAALRAQFARSSWVKDAQALELEIRQAAGQPVAPESQSDDELKLLALSGLAQNDPDRALPILERMLSSGDSSQVKDRALFVLTQSRSPRAREILTRIAKENGSPDLQMRAIRALGVMGGADNRQVLDDVYRTATDAGVKRAILQSYMVSGARDRLLSLAKGESDPALRGAAVQQLGVMHATTELMQLYESETAPEIRKQILQAMFVAGDADRLSQLAKSERDPGLRRAAIMNLGLIHGTAAQDALLSIYASDASPDIKAAVINALFLQQNATALVSLAKSEKSLELKKDIVSKLSLMKSKEATDYLTELLK
jgi:tetratricopeptide (TPR) repeat protein